MAHGELPAEWETLPHAARVRKAVEVGKGARTDATAATLLRAWRTGGFTQRLLAAFACHGSRDEGTLVALVADPSRRVARAALAVLCDVGSDEALLGVLGELSPKTAVRTLLKALRRDRPNVFDRFVADRAAAGDGVAWALLPYAAGEILDRYCTTAAERGGSLFWERLTSVRPERAAAEMVARLNAVVNPDGLLFYYARQVTAALGDHDPEAALAVAAALRRHVPLESIPLQPLVARRPGEVADLALAAAEPVAVRFDRVEERFDADRLIALYRRRPSLLGAPERWLARLAPAARAAVWRELAPAWTSSDGTVPPAVVARLPGPLRHAEARRTVALPVLATRPFVRLNYVALLPWDEAKTEAKPWLAHPEAEYRAAALAALCESARFDRTRLGELLELVVARKHEQDPVRQAFLGALAGLPPGRWTGEHLPVLARVIRDALDAADLSPASVGALGRLVFRLLPFHPDWAVERLAEITRERGFPGWSGRPLTAEEVRRIAPALTPVAKSWLNREREGWIVALAALVGRRLPDWPELAALLERLIFGTFQSYTAARALDLLAQNAPAERERLIPAALAKDESWVLQPTVMNFLNRRRQDLLTPFLGQRAYSGRFGTAKLRRVLPFDNGFARWTDTQQEIFAGSLAEIAATPARKKDEQNTWDVIFAVKRLAELPAVGPERLVALAADARPAVQETAVRALGRLDARQGIAELLDALGDARARWAVYALRQALKDLPPPRVLAVMRNVPRTKVTVAKEALRLAGELGGSAALGWFAELAATDLHRDVRGALLRALWDHLDRPESWAVLESSAGSPDTGVVIGLARIPVERISDAARQRVADLFRRLLDHPEPTVRVAVLERLAAQPVPDPGRTVLAACLAKLASAIPDERQAGLAAALAAASNADAPVFAAAFARLLPRRRELAAAATEFHRATHRLGTRLVEVRSAVLEVVGAEPALTVLALMLAAARFPALGFARWVLRLSGTDRWNLASQGAALGLLTGGGRSAEELEQVEAEWCASSDPAARWLALRVLVTTAGLQGWTAPRRERLDRYRNDPSPLVADEAALIFPEDSEPAAA